MKAFSLLLVGVLFSTLAFANGTDEPGASASSVAVTNSSGSSLVKVYYKAEEAGKVKISILKDSEVIFSETLTRISGFVRPYNFDGLSAGDYVVQIEDKFGKRTEHVTYGTSRIEKYISIVKLAEEGKYLLSVNSKSADRINVSVYNDRNEMIHSHNQKVESGFAEVLNLKSINSFTIEVSDSQGVLKTLKN